MPICPLNISSISAALPSPPGIHRRDVPYGLIYIDFAPYSRWNPPTDRPPDNEPRGTARPSTITINNHDNTAQAVYAHSSRVWINTNRIPEHTDESMVMLLAHEILHSIFWGHPDHRIYDDSVMRSRVPRGFADRILGPVDADAILAVYEALDPFATTADSLGAWSSTSFHLRGNLGDVSFGVATRMAWRNHGRPVRDRKRIWRIIRLYLAAQPGLAASWGSLPNRNHSPAPPI